MLEHGFARFVSDWCAQNEVLLIADEIQTGCGRTGKWWGHEHLNIKPDVIAFAKGIASGYPLAGIISRAEYFRAIHPNGLGGTYNGNAVSLSAGAATIDIIEDVIMDVEEKGEYVKKRMQAHPLVKEIRQYGLMIGIDLCLSSDKMTGILHGAPEQGILLLGAGRKATIRLLPPLTVSHAELSEACTLIERILDRIPSPIQSSP